MTDATIGTDLNFALIPEWLLYSDVSAQALRLYAVLSRYADRDGNAFPARKTLATKIKATSTKTVDRALKELVEAGAVTVRGRVDDAGDQTSNHYIVRRTTVREVAPQQSLGGDIPDATPRQQSRDGRDTEVPTVGTEMSHEREPLEREPLERTLLVAADATTSIEKDEPQRDDVDRLCDLLADRIESNGSKRPTITKAWRTSARLLIDRDQRTEEQITKAINWCQDDEFWRTNILSMPKLREQYDRLRLAAQRQQAAPRQGVDWDAALAQAADTTARLEAAGRITPEGRIA